MENQLYVKCEECKFHVSKVSFQGYIISQEGVAMDKAKVAAVTKWPMSMTIKKLQHFLSFANFYGTRV